MSALPLINPDAGHGKCKACKRHRSLMLLGTIKFCGECASKEIGRIIDGTKTGGQT